MKRGPPILLLKFNHPEASGKHRAPLQPDL